MRKVLIAAAGALALSGCTSVPVARHFPASPQQIAMSASHWRVVADASATKMKGRLEKLGEERVFVAPSGGRSEFEQGFGGMLATALTERGVGVLHRPAGAEKPMIRYEVQVVRHGHGYTPHPAGLAFLGSVAGSAVWAADAGLPSAAAGPFIGAGLGAVASGAANFLPAAPSVEIIVTTALSHNGADVERKTDVYYVQASDAREYDPGSPLVPVFVRQH